MFQGHSEDITVKPCILTPTYRAPRGPALPLQAPTHSVIDTGHPGNQAFAGVHSGLTEGPVLTLSLTATPAPEDPSPLSTTTQRPELPRHGFTVASWLKPPSGSYLASSAPAWHVCLVVATDPQPSGPGPGQEQALPRGWPRGGRDDAVRDVDAHWSAAFLKLASSPQPSSGPISRTSLWLMRREGEITAI